MGHHQSFLMNSVIVIVVIRKYYAGNHFRIDDRFNSFNISNDQINSIKRIKAQYTYIRLSCANKLDLGIIVIFNIAYVQFTFDRGNQKSINQMV